MAFSDFEKGYGESGGILNAEVAGDARWTRGFIARIRAQLLFLCVLGASPATSALKILLTAKGHSFFTRCLFFTSATIMPRMVCTS